MSDQSKILQKRFEDGFEEMVPDKGTRKILLNAIEVFSRKGLTGAKIRDIASKAGFSQGFVYNYFKSKEEIFTRIADLAAEGAGNSARYASELEGTPYQKIYWLTEALLSTDSIAMQHWRFIMVLSVASDDVPQEAIRITKEKMKRPFQYLISILAEGQKAGEIIPEDPLMLAVTYFSMIQGLGIARLQNSSSLPFPPVELVLSFLRNNASKNETESEFVK